MTKIVTVLVLAIAVLASSVAAGTPDVKTYKLTLANPSKIGGNQLAPGEYKLAVDTASVRVIEVEDRQIGGSDGQSRSRRREIQQYRHHFAEGGRHQRNP